VILMTLILRCDIAGTPVEWITPQGAARLYCLDRVAWEFGDIAARLRGGRSALTGLQSVIDVRAILAGVGRPQGRYNRQVPPLHNRALFRRDGHMCLYCGGEFAPAELTRDHVVPSSRGGPDSWENCVTACRRCNQHKADRTPEEAGLRLLAVPYAPKHAEYLILANRRIVADQMAFLRQRVGAGSPLESPFD